MSDLLERARAWAAEDPDPATRAELEALIEQGESDELADRFDGTLEFGTAGLRGALGAGPNRMNRVVVTRAAAGLAAYLTDTGAPAGASVVIGYDARHNSDVFARDTAEVMTGVGFKALVMPRPLPTPLLAFAIRELGCVAGVMVTASHNPPQDNGYKVYLGDGSQIVPPADAEIASRIAAVGPWPRFPAAPPAGSWTRTSSTATSTRSPAWRATGRATCAPSTRRCTASVARPCCRCWRPPASRRRRWSSSRRSRTPSSRRWRSPTPRSPARWTSPWRWRRPTTSTWWSPTTRTPTGARPPSRASTGGGCCAATRSARCSATTCCTRGSKGTYACSIVSSSLLGKMAAEHGQKYVETLTGFKWISRVPDLAFGYEEALGYCVDPEHVKDKDGVSALLLLCEIAAIQKARGRTLMDVLDHIATHHGLHATDQLSIRVSDLSLIADAMSRLRDAPPSSLGGLAVESVEDLSLGSADLPPTDGLRYRLAEGARVIVRPSGTEPKLKAYLEVVIPVHPDDGVDAARIAAAGRLDAIKGDVKAALGI